MRVLTVGGGSGGHVTPIVAVLNELNKQKSIDKAWIVTDRSFFAQAQALAANSDVPLDVIAVPAGKLRRYHHFKLIDYLFKPSIFMSNFIDVFKIIGGFFKSVYILFRLKPDVVFMKGGYVCLPVGWAAKVLGYPIVIHDSDARPGLTNRLLAPLAMYIATGFPLENYNYDPNKSVYTGVPIYQSFQLVDADTKLRAKRKMLSEQVITDTPETLVVAFAGSLGSATINQAFISAARQMSGDRSVQFYLITGKNKYREAIKQAEGLKNIALKDFVAQGMDELLAAADIVVARGSATGLQELAGLGKAVIAVPARQLSDQHRNVIVFAKADSVVEMTDERLDRGELTAAIRELLGDPARRQQLADNLHAFAQPTAASRVASLLVKSIKS